MQCPYCGYIDLKVIDSRPALDGDAIRRRRECTQCNQRFTTYERVEKPRLFVVKRDGSREEFSREKLLKSMLIASRKRDLSVEVLQAAVERIEGRLYGDGPHEVPTDAIGESVLQELRTLDPVAYIRFASVYRQFHTVEDFLAIVRDVRSQR
jgi:transcriptional repressor NrdR